MASNEGIISSLYLPTSHQTLLLPNVSVAEIVDYQSPSPQGDGPDWLLGHIDWRGNQLPVVSFDNLVGDQLGEIHSNARIAVINTISKHHSKMAFFAIVTQGIPRLIKVDNESLQKNSDAKTRKGEKAAVMIGGEPATIPDLDYIEDQLMKIA